jgi:hypothetical protein
MNKLGFDISIEKILFGNASFENNKNSKVFKHLLARRISQVCWQIVPESNSTWEKRTLI